jgi:uncharacterized protein
MLLEFRIGNFRSIKDIQTFSMVSSTDKTHTSHIEGTGITAIPHVLKSAVIYGANASGKTSLLMAFDYFKTVVAESATFIQPGQTYNLQGFKLDDAFADKPSIFEIDFLLNGLRYTYDFQMTPSRFLSESLSVYRTNRPTLVFARSFDGKKDVYEFGTYLTGPKKIWEESTRSNALFLSTAAQLNSEQLLPIYQWITSNIVYFPAQSKINMEHSTALLATREGQEKVKSFMESADLSIDEISTSNRKSHYFQNPLSSSNALAEDREVKVPVFKHVSPNGSATFELYEESTGTQRLFSLVAPVLDVLKEGRILLVDELDASLHPLLMRLLINMFHSKDKNTNKAQLIFTTHDTSLLDPIFFRRDQIWFTEKDSNQATLIYPLTDFSPRKKEALEKGYLMGRYGAIPFINDSPTIITENQNMSN